jgi:hypothetical protein
VTDPRILRNTDKSAPVVDVIPDTDPDKTLPEFRSNPEVLVWADITAAKLTSVWTSTALVNDPALI